MKLSVIIPVWNGARSLGQAIASVLEQTLACSEILVVDDASEDDSIAVARGFGDPVRVLSRTERGGPAAARNTGIAAACGDVLTFLDADDLWMPDKLAWQAKEIGAGADYVLGWMDPFFDGGVTEKERREMRAGLYPTSIAVTRDCLTRVGLLNETIPAVEWLDWIHRARHVGAIGVEKDRVCVRRRIHPGNWTRSKPRVVEGAMMLARAAIARKRSAEG